MRLIDADELMEHVWRDKLDSRELIAKMIDNMPTVAKWIPVDVLDNIRSEIADLMVADVHGDYWRGFNDALIRVAQIINKYKEKKAD